MKLIEALRGTRALSYQLASNVRFSIQRSDKDRRLEHLRGKYAEERKKERVDSETK